MARIEEFDFEPGTILADKYEVIQKLGQGWESEVYRVREKGTGVHRAAKIFYPHRNKDAKALNFTAKKLHTLRTCGVITQYHSREEVLVDDIEVHILFSELVDGIMLERFMKSLPGGRMHQYEALHLLRKLAQGVACIHERGEYHGDIHDNNIMIKRRGAWHDVMLIDVYNHGKCTQQLQHEDVVDIIRVFYDVLGGQKHYARQPQWVKSICCGLKRGIIKKKFKTAQHLVIHLDSFEWE